MRPPRFDGIIRIPNPGLLDESMTAGLGAAGRRCPGRRGIPQSFRSQG